MSLISEQVTELRNEAEWQALTNQALARVISHAADTIEELSAKLAAQNMERSTAYYNGGWISCKKLLPDKPIFGEDSYLVQNSVIRTPYTAYWNGEKWTDDYDAEILGIVAWRPLPEPYKGE